ncbi:hypothetical protein BsWGS_21086 [Bradybaena similaris]
MYTESSCSATQIKLLKSQQISCHGDALWAHNWTPLLAWQFQQTVFFGFALICLWLSPNPPVKAACGLYKISHSLKWIGSRSYQLDLCKLVCLSDTIDVPKCQ